jgi:spectinomycin phosphotransferase
VRDRPDGVTERDVARALADGWGLSAASLRYAPVGGGSYHWIAADDRGRRWFVTVDDLDDKGWLGRTRAGVLAGLRAALDAAVTLRRDASLGFVVAPIPARDGDPVHPLGTQDAAQDGGPVRPPGAQDAGPARSPGGGRYAVTVFPFLPGEPGRWDEVLPAPERAELVAMLAALHRMDPVAVRLHRMGLGLSWRGDLEQALADLGRPWTGGPFAEPARALLAAAAGPVRRELDALDRQAAALATREPVITHGEPHPANVIHGDNGALMLIDWDTVALAPPERDLWMVATETGDELRRYTELAGRPVDRSLLETYRVRWALDDISCFVRDLRAPHHRTPGTEHAYQALDLSVAQLT